MGAYEEISCSCTQTAYDHINFRRLPPVGYTPGWGALLFHRFISIHAAPHIL